MLGRIPNALAATDLSGDGRPDFAIAGYEEVSVPLDDGHGAFAPIVAYPAGLVPTSVAIADFDGDGAPDLAVACSYSETVSVLRAEGLGTFAAAVEYALGTATAASISRR
jgi:hypothetical protein